tara:strand:+ start:60 stop:1007 length:948 start_codon:yes stop_codon:yes gene_type:complete
MANNKLHGYNPDPSKETEHYGSATYGNRLDKVNPYEFRKGMDYELIDLGCTRLSESSEDERRKCTEIVLKNLGEHGGYYSALIQFEGGMNQAGQIDKMTFKKYLEENFPNTAGTGMICVKKEFKNDKMTELKEAIKREISNILEVKEGRKKGSENKETDGTDDDTLQNKFDKGSAKAISADIKEKEDAKKEINKKKSEAFAIWKSQTAAADGNPKKKKAATDKYKKIGYKAQADIKAIDDKLKELENELLGVKQESKSARREIAKSMMEKDIHLEILEIIREAGINLREGAKGVKVYYEIAKTAYMEGLTAGLKN